MLASSKALVSVPRAAVLAPVDQNRPPIYWQQSPLAAHRFGGTAGAQLNWHDVITLFAPGAAPGTMLSFNISAPMHASLNSSDCTAGNALATNYFEVDRASISYGRARVRHSRHAVLWSRSGELREAQTEVIHPWGSFTEL